MLGGPARSTAVRTPTYSALRPRPSTAPVGNFVSAFCLANYAGTGLNNDVSVYYVGSAWRGLRVKLPSRDCCDHPPRPCAVARLWFAVALLFAIVMFTITFKVRHREGQGRRPKLVCACTARAPPPRRSPFPRGTTTSACAP